MARASKAPSPVDGYVAKASWTLQNQLDKAGSVRVEMVGDDATMWASL